MCMQQTIKISNHNTTKEKLVWANKFEECNNNLIDHLMWALEQKIIQTWTYIYVREVQEKIKTQNININK